MATRFYLPNTESATPFSKDTTSNWRTFIGTRSMNSDIPQADTLTTRTHSGGDGGNGDSLDDPDGRWHTYVLYKQFVSPPLAAQTIPANTQWRLQCQIDKLTTAAAYATDLHYLRFRGSLVSANNAGTYSSYVGESTAEASNGQVIQNRTVTGGTGTARTVLAGARFVLEVGVHSSYASEPSYIPQHALRFGYNSAGWLPGSDIVSTSTTLSPWWELDHDVLFQRELVASTGSFSLVGGTPFLWANKVEANAGTFGLSGKDAALTRTRVLTADRREYVLDGQDVAFTVGKTITADAGAFTLSGQAVDLLATRTAEFAAGALTLSGQAVELNHGFASQMDAGAFVVDGQDAGFVVGKGVAAGTGVFVVNGQDAALVYSGTPPVTGNGTQCDTLAWMLIDEPGGSW